MTTEQFSALTRAIDLSRLPAVLADRLSVPINQDKAMIRLSLSEEEAEIILDAIEPTLLSEKTTAESYQRIQSFLVSLREK